MGPHSRPVDGIGNSLFPCFHALNDPTHYPDIVRPVPQSRPNLP